MSSAGCPRRTGLPREVVKWLQSLELSPHPKNVRRDLSNGYLVAEILSRFYSRDFVVHSYDRGSSLAAKQGNWSQIEKSLRKLSLTLTKETVDGIIHCKPGAAELLVQEFYSILTHRRVQLERMDMITIMNYLNSFSASDTSRPRSSSTASEASKNNLKVAEVLEQPDVTSKERKA